MFARHVSKMLLLTLLLYYQSTVWWWYTGLIVAPWCDLLCIAKAAAWLRPRLSRPIHDAYGGVAITYVLVLLHTAIGGNMALVQLALTALILLQLNRIAPMLFDIVPIYHLDWNALLQLAHHRVLVWLMPPAEMRTPHVVRVWVVDPLGHVVPLHVPYDATALPARYTLDGIDVTNGHGFPNLLVGAEQSWE